MTGTDKARETVQDVLEEMRAMTGNEWSDRIDAAMRRDDSPTGNDPQDDRFPRGLRDAIKYADDMEEAAEGLFQHVFEHESDGEDCGTVILQRVLGYLKYGPNGRTHAAPVDALAREEAAHMETIKRRDDAEEALGDMFAAATGRIAEWSSAWGYTDAIDEVEEHVAALERKAARTPAVQVIDASPKGGSDGEVQP